MTGERSLEWDIIISGAGAGGLTLASYLAGRGHRILVLDPRMGIGPIRRGELIQPLGLGILEELDLLEELWSLPHYRNESFRFLDGKGNLLMRSRYDSLGGRFPYAVSLEPHLLDGIMADRLKADPGVVFKFGCRYRSHRSGAEGITVEWEDAQGIRTARSSVLVADDGRRSGVRENGRFPGKVMTYKDSYLSWSFDLPSDAPPFLLEPEGRYFIGRGKIFFVFSVSPTRRYFLYMLKNGDRHVFDSRGTKGFLDEIEGWIPGLGNHLEASGLTDVTAVPEMRVMKVSLGNWTDGRVVLLGDAAHAMNPHVAQGRNQAMEDARVLAPILSGFLNGGARNPDLLKGYERFRRPVTESLHRLADEMTLVWNTSNPLVVPVRERVFRGIGRRSELEKKIVRTISGTSFQPLTAWDKFKALWYGAVH